MKNLKHIIIRSAAVDSLRASAMGIVLCAMMCVMMLVAACTPTPENPQIVESLPPMYPDYADVTIPRNIAPLNFLLRGDFDGVEAVAAVDGQRIQANSSDNTVRFDIDEWKALLAHAVGKDISVTVTARHDGTWRTYKTFTWSVVADSLDPYLTYRLIEPDYEIWNQISIRERCVETFDERAISDHSLVDNRCMNCHTYANRDPRLSMLYVRGEGGGAILNRDGHLSKLGIKTADMVSGSVYFGFSPSGRYITFSTNVIIPAFHSMPSKRLEVFDSASDVYVADMETNTILRSPLLSDSTVFETFPTFTPDGRYIYYCAARKVALPQDLEHLQYHLVRIPFDERTGTIGSEVDTLRLEGTHRSVCHPRVSPDGRHLLYTVQAYGTFPIWHPEADLQMMDLQTGAIDTLAMVNSDKSDPYHSWSSNSRWFVFTSKRGDGMYAQLFLSSIDDQGRCTKPFLLPQRNPRKYYSELFDSYNVPDFTAEPVQFDVREAQRQVEHNERVQVTPKY